MYVSLQVMSDFADAMLAIASRSRIIPTSIQAAVVPSLESVEKVLFSLHLLKEEIWLGRIYFYKKCSNYLRKTQRPFGGTDEIENYE